MSRSYSENMVPVTGNGRDMNLPAERYHVYDPQLSLGGQQAEQDGFQFWELARTVFRRKWLILAILIIGTVASAVMTLRVTPLYRAFTSIEIQPQDLQIIEGGQLDRNQYADFAYMQTQLNLINSRSLAERVAERLNLIADPRYSNQSSDRALRLRQASERVRGGTSVNPVGRSRVITIQHVSADPVEAARIANAVAENFIESNLERKYNTTVYAQDFLTERLASAKETLENAERSIVLYAQEEGILDLSGESGSTSLDANQLIALNQELADAQSDKIQAEQKYLELLASPSAVKLVETEEISRLKAQRSELVADYREKLGVFKPDFPEMVQLQARIDAIDGDIEAEQSAIVSGAKATYEAAKAREDSLQGRVDELKIDVQDLRERRIQYTILQREVDTARSQYDALLQRFKEVSIAGGVGSSQVSIVDRAVVPGAPFSPNLRASLMRAFVLSALLGVGLAFALNFIDDTIKTPDDVKNKLGLPALGVIPRVKGRDDLILEELDDPKSEISEAFFSARTALEFTTATGAPRSLLVTSTRPGEGKTSSTVSLATAFAKVGRRVLIIDADMRKPSFVADGGESVGLSGLLTREHDLMDNVISAKIEGLHLLPSGVIPPNPAELLSSSKLRLLIEEAEEHFDLVLVDSPPVMSFTDAPILGASCKGALVVVKSGKVRRPAVERTIARLRESKTNILGAVLMQFDAKKAGYDYGYYYYAYGKGAYSYGDAKISRSSSSSSKRKIRLFTGEQDESNER